MRKLVVFLLILAAFLIMSACEYPQPKEYKVLQLITDKNVEGSFFLGTGYIDSDVYFYAYVQDIDGGIRLFKTEAYNTIIYQEDRDSAILINKYVETDSGTYEKYCYYLPENTIIPKIDIGLQRD